MQYKWNIQEIEALSNQQLKQVLLTELHNNLNISKQMPFNVWKKQTIIEYEFIFSYSEILAELLDHIISTADFNQLETIILPQITNLTPDDIVNTSLNLLSELPENIYYKEFQKLINENHINIKDFNLENPICKYNRGRTYKDQNVNPYISYYIKHNLEDYNIFMHELGHALNYMLFKTSRNANFQTNISELESIFFELQMNNYLSKYNSNLIKKALDYNRFTKTLYYVLQLKIQETILTHNLDYQLINQTIHEYKKDYNINSSTICETTSLPTKKIYNYIISHILAEYILMNDYCLFKKLYTSKLDTIDEILVENNINPKKLILCYNELYTNSIKTKRILIGDEND